MYLVSADWKCDLLNELGTVSMIYFSEKYLPNVNPVVHWSGMLEHSDSAVGMYYKILKGL